VILSEASVGSGARRIEAVTAGEAWEHLHGRARELDDVRAELEQARREAKKPKKEAQRVEVEPEIVVMGETNVIVMEVEGVGGQELLDLSDRFKQRSAPAAIVLGSREDGSANLVVNFDDTVAAKLSAGDVVKQIAPLVGGGGGGRPTMARAGGKEPDNLPTALARARELISAALS
jgi:alanyl-tRNA synthetase